MTQPEIDRYVRLCEAGTIPKKTIFALYAKMQLQMDMNDRVARLASELETAITDVEHYQDQISKHVESVFKKHPDKTNQGRLI